MSEEQTLILGHQAILTKIDRMAGEICEEYTDGKELVICGMNTRGYFIAERLAEQVATILPQLSIKLLKVDTENSATPVLVPELHVQNRHVVVVDDVINTGKTLMHVLQYIFSQNPETIKTAFLAKREHRNYPVKADFVGISLATTLQEHVIFDNSNPNSLQVYLN